MKKKPLSLLLLFSLAINTAAPVFAEEAGQTAEEQATPQGIKDLRRFEIITLGALPFVTMDTALIFSTVDYISSGGAGAAPSPFPTKTYDSFSDFMTDPMILTAIGVSVGIGLTDYFVRLIKRTKKSHSAQRQQGNLSITPIEADPDAIKIELDSVPDTAGAPDDVIYIEDIE